ncbi:MAG: hypothetical protein LW854_03020 [Rubrivivax sp.]|jgi:hypothetical protein|nr:hypothetical protein [Rubrivivax sp.]
MHDDTEAIAHEAARLIAETGLDYASAKAKAARALDLRRPTIPSDEAVEAALREHIELFCAQTQPQELQALRQLALAWMERLGAHQPHLSGAVWRGTATRHSPISIDLYADDPKAVPIELLNRGVPHEVTTHDRGRRETTWLIVQDRIAAWSEPVAVQLAVRETDELRGALKPDSQGRSWRGALPAVRAMVAAGARPAGLASGAAA